MVVQHNLKALNSNRMLGLTTKTLAKSTEKLSSGYRINRAADDAAGLAISEKMRAQIRGLNQASTNAADGISLIQTAEGALNEAQSIMQRMRELSIQAANETNTESDREGIQAEINQLTSEINRIGNTTEFNTKKLLMGNTAEAVTTEGNVTTLAEAEMNESSGVVNNFKTVQNSTLVGAEAISKILLASKDTNATVSTVSSVEGKAGVKSQATMSNITFMAESAGDASGSDDAVDYNGIIFDIQSYKTGTDTVDITNGKVVFQLSTATLDKMLEDGEVKTSELHAVLKELNGSEKVAALDSTGVTKNFNMIIPENGDSDKDITSVIQTLRDNAVSSTIATGVAGGSASVSATTAGAANAVTGKLSFKLETQFKEHGDTITIAGKTYTAVIEDAANGIAADKTKGEFKIGTITSGVVTLDDLNTQAAALKASIIEATKIDVNGTLTAILADDSSATNEIKLKEVAKYEGKAGYSGTEKITTAGSGNNTSLVVKDANGQNMTVEVKSGTAVAAAYDKTKDKITITLDGVNPGSNSVEKIEEAIRQLEKSAEADKTTTIGGEKVIRDFSKITVSSEGNWDAISKALDTNGKVNSLSGGIAAQLGKYSFDAAQFADGDILNIGDESFVAKADGANSSRGEFVVGNMTSLKEAIAASKLGENYKVEVSGTTITLTEKKATGEDLSMKDISVTAGGTTGEYSVAAVEELIKDGGKFVIDGVEIGVSSKAEHVGYEDGTVIKEAASVEEQTQALADAINKNATLSKKYTASVEDGALKLVQNYASEEGPSVSATTSTKGNFELKLQIGANYGQAMTVNIEDNRALALGISGDKDTLTVKASSGAIAHYTETVTVNNGSDNTNIERALDVSSHENAAAATAVIDDALNAISRQRSLLGAAQNRLEHTINNLDNTSENLTSAESQIRDTDMAEEMVKYSNNNILAQAGQAMLAQANQANQGVLSLLG